MKKIMIKTVCAIAIISVVVLACSKNMIGFGSQQQEFMAKFDGNGYWSVPGFKFKLNKEKDNISYYGTNSEYGAYLAGRVAHIRQNFDTAAEYYKIVLEKNPNNIEVNRAVYVLFSSLGNFDEASVYAQKEIELKQKNTIAPLIVAIKNFSDGNYAETHKNLNILEDTVYKTIINPMINAWAYAGENNEKKAIAELNKLPDDPLLQVLKHYHSAMIYDFLGNKTKASEEFSVLIKKYANNMTYRMLEVTTDFYSRVGNKELAHQIAGKYKDGGALSILLADINSKIDTISLDTPAVINTPKKGVAEALFNIGTIYRSTPNGDTFAQIYTAASSYLNPDYDISKIAIADMLEKSDLLLQANQYYNEIKPESGSYFIAQVKMIENLNKLEKTQEAEEALKELLKKYPNNTQLLSDLGDIVRKTKGNADAIKIYKQALDSLPQINANSWPIFYSLGISYDRNNERQKAEENLQKALELSNRDANVLNYLGYTWLMENKNTDEAIKMILDAYNKYPYEGHIIDSLGWVYFRIGNYEKSIEYLEQASDLNPANAVISDHLGDAYWFNGRKNEAIFQWQHALILKEDADIINKDVINQKIESGLVDNSIIKIKDAEIEKNLFNL